MYTNLTFCFSFWGKSPRLPGPAPRHVNPVHCKILGTLMLEKEMWTARYKYTALEEDGGAAQNKDKSGLCLN